MGMHCLLIITVKCLYAPPCFYFTSVVKGAYFPDFRTGTPKLKSKDFL